MRPAGKASLQPPRKSFETCDRRLPFPQQQHTRWQYRVI